MAAGDTYLVAGASIANAAVMTLQPAGAAEARIETVEGPGPFTVYRYVDGTNDIPIASGNQTMQFTPGLKVTNAFYIVVKNTSGSAQYMAASGVCTK